MLHVSRFYALSCSGKVSTEACFGLVEVTAGVGGDTVQIAFMLDIHEL